MCGKWIRPERREAIYVRDDYTCIYCLRDLRYAKHGGIHLDHLRPQVKGGGNHNSNLVTACYNCNCSRQARNWREFAAKYGGAVRRIIRQRRRVVDNSIGRAVLAQKGA